MSKITIDYSEINSAAKKARSASGYFEDFEDELERKVSKKLSNLPGSDTRGNIGNAKDIVSAKIKELREKKKYYSNLASSLETLADNIEYEEKSVVTDVRYIATEALELNRQSKWQAFCQWAYGTFCVDLMNWNPITRFIGNGIKKGLDWIQKIGTKVVNFFKYGYGRYILDIALDICAVVASIAGTVAAIALAVGTGGTATPLVVAAIASTISTVMTVIDSSVSVYNKAKALDMHKEDPGRARYYGNIDGVNDAIKKTDMGGQTANNVWEAVGTGYDVAHVAADVTAFVAGSYGKAGLSYSPKKGPDGRMIGVEYNPAKAKSNFKNVMLDKIGVNKRNGKWKWDPKRLIIKTKETKTGAYTLSEKYADYVTKKQLTKWFGDKKKVFDGIEKSSKYVKKVYKQVTNFDTIFSDNTGIGEKAKSIWDIADGTKFRISTPLKDISDTAGKIIDTIVDLAS